MPPCCAATAPGGERGGPRPEAVSSCPAAMRGPGGWRATAVGQGSPGGSPCCACAQHSPLCGRTGPGKGRRTFSGAVRGRVRAARPRPTDRVVPGVRRAAPSRAPWPGVSVVSLGAGAGQRPGPAGNARGRTASSQPPVTPGCPPPACEPRPGPPRCSFPRILPPEAAGALSPSPLSLPPPLGRSGRFSLRTQEHEPAAKAAQPPSSESLPLGSGATAVPPSARVCGPGLEPRAVPALTGGSAGRRGGPWAAGA